MNCKEQLAIANKRISKLSAKNQKLAEQKQDFKRRYENTRRKVVSKFSWWELIFFGIQKLVGIEREPEKRRKDER